MKQWKKKRKAVMMMRRLIHMPKRASEEFKCRKRETTREQEKISRNRINEPPKFISRRGLNFYETSLVRETT
jgi:hypothetical protein